MELLLNLIWALLAVSVFSAWSRRTTRTSRHGFVILICLLALLLPVISATDDLHAMRPEMEDSSSTRKSFRHATNDRVHSHGALHYPPAIQSFVTGLLPNFEFSWLSPALACVTGSNRNRDVANNRAPPFVAPL